jgi:hypothetical protein
MLHGSEIALSPAMTNRVSLAELAAADVQLRPAEAVAIVAEICRQFTSGHLRGIPSPGIIRLTADGDIVAQGPMTTEDAGVWRAVHLLNDLLPDVEAPAAYRANGGLRLVMARALRTLDLPPYETLDEFRTALVRFAEPDLSMTVRRLFRAWDTRRNGGSAVVARALTISDIRRARRATGLSLDDLAGAADVPAARLRELEWGYLRNWRADDEGRAEVVRYARAAGLDEQVVLSIVWPMLEQAPTMVDVEVEPEPVTALVLPSPQALATVRPAARRRRGSRLASWSLAAVAAALLALATFGLSAESAHYRGPIKAETSGVPVQAREVEERAYPAPPPIPRATASRQKARPAAARQRRPASRNRSFFGRELFRIVIR